MNKRLFSLSVGIDSYLDPRISPLRFAVADAYTFHEAIVRTVDSTPNQNFLLCNDQATLREFRRAIDVKLAQAAGIDDMVVIFFAGHGSPETSNIVDNVSRYIVMHDTDYESVFATAIDLERDFVRLIERIPSRQILVLLDSCFSGRAGGRTFEGPTLAQRKLERRGPSVNLNQIELGEGRVVISACDDSQLAQEDERLGHGIFTFHLMKCLTQQSVEEPTISVLHIYDEVATNVARQTDGLQHPVINGRARLFRFPRLNPS